MRTSGVSWPSWCRCGRDAVSGVGAGCVCAGARGYDQGGGWRRWRHLDAGLLVVRPEVDAPRVACPEHGPTVVAVPWARHKAGCTRAFDDTVAWPAVATAKSTLCHLLRIAWRTVGSIVARVAADAVAAKDPLAGLRRIGIDEISYKRGHRYLMVVVDHDAKQLVWAAPGRDRATLRKFFQALGPDRCAQVTHVSADGADWIADVVGERCPAAVLCADPYHLVSWITDALDEVRRGVWNDARRTGDEQAARRLKGRPVRAVEEPRGPDRTPAGQAGLDRRRAQAAAPGPGAEGSVPQGDRRQGRPRLAPAGRLAGLGVTIETEAVRAGRPQAPPAPAGHREHARTQPVQCPDRVNEHQAETADAQGIRVPRHRRPDRPGHARPRQPPTRPARPGKLIMSTDESGEPERRAVGTAGACDESIAHPMCPFRGGCDLRSFGLIA